MTQESTRITMRAVTGIIVLAGFIAVSTYIIVVQPVFNKDTVILVGTLIGFLSAKADTVVGWYFGSSESSSNKTKAMERVLTNAGVGKQDTTKPIDS